MKAIHSIIFTLSLVLATAVSYAQSSEKAENILNKASRVFEQSDGIKLSFTLSPDTSDGGAFETQKGTAFIKKDKFKLDMPYSTIWFNGSTQWVLLKDANEVNISNPTPEEVASISPLGILNMYKTNYLLKEPIERTFNGKIATEIEMTPINKWQDFERLVIMLDNKTNNVVMIRFKTRDGNKSKLIISDYSGSNKFTNDLFQFNKDNHPGVEIIDLR